MKKHTQECSFGSGTNQTNEKPFNILKYDTCCAFSQLNIDSEGFLFQSWSPLGIRRITNPYGNLTLSPTALTIDEFVNKLNENDYGSLKWSKDGCKLKTKVLKSQPISSLEFTAYSVFKYSAYVLFAKSNHPVYSSFSDATDLTPFNSAQRNISSGALHYINWLEINGQDILGHQSLQTDTFRIEFQDISIGNRGELDLVGDSSANAKTWAKNYCDFINSKLNSNNIPGVQYFIPSSEAITNASDYTKYEYDFYIIVPSQTSIDNIQFSSYTVIELDVATNWVFNPHTAEHEFDVVLFENVNVLIEPSINGVGGSSNYNCNLNI